MKSALQYLQGFENEALQALTEEQLQDAIEIAFLTVDAEMYGQLANIAAANLAAHQLLSQKASSSKMSNGQFVSERAVGPRREKFGGGSSSARSDGFDRTPYGAEYLRYSNMIGFGGWNTGLYGR